MRVIGGGGRSHWRLARRNEGDAGIVTAGLYQLHVFSYQEGKHTVIVLEGVGTRRKGSSAHGALEGFVVILWLAV